MEKIKLKTIKLLPCLEKEKYSKKSIQPNQIERKRINGEIKLEAQAVNKTTYQVCECEICYKQKQNQPTNTIS